MSHPELAARYVTTRRRFLQSVSLAATTSMLSAARTPQSDPTLDAQRMRSLAAFTAQTLQTPHPVPFGAMIVQTETGNLLMRATNAVAEEHDPSAHAELRTIRLACHQLNSPSLRGYTLYTTCEPCPMCMACALWARMDRVVYGATIADAARFLNQIQIPAAEVVKRSDMTCVVDGPIERDVCFALFTDPNMQKMFKLWNSQKP